MDTELRQEPLRSHAEAHRLAAPEPSGPPTRSGLLELAGSEVEGVSALADRLEDPVARLGDVIRTVAGLLEQTGPETQLPRLADVARSRVTTVEALTSDLVRAARTRRQRLAALRSIDLRGVLQHAAELASPAAPSGRTVLDLPDEPVSIEWPAGPMTRALGLLVTTARNHLVSDAQVAVRLTAVEEEAIVTVHVPRTRIPAGELLRVVGHFRDRHDDELPLGVSLRPACVEARNDLVTATSTSVGTTFVVRLPR